MPAGRLRLLHLKAGKHRVCAGPQAFETVGSARQVALVRVDQRRQPLVPPPYIGRAGGSSVQAKQLQARMGDGRRLEVSRCSRGSIDARGSRDDTEPSKEQDPTYAIQPCHTRAFANPPTLHQAVIDGLALLLATAMWHNACSC